MKAKEAKEIAPLDTSHELTDGKGDMLAPAFVEAETLFDRMADVTDQIARRAFEFFCQRGGELGQELEDWFRAESELLRPVPVEVTEIDGAILVTAAVPGFEADEIEVSVKDDALIMSGTSQARERKADENVTLDEWTSSQFLRQLTLPSPVDSTNVTATLRDGMLELKLPKKAAEEPAKISVAEG
jgi:HSP20 family protein